MPMKRVIFYLGQDEYDKLKELSHQEIPSQPPRSIAYLLREAVREWLGRQAGATGVWDDP